MHSLCIGLWGETAVKRSTTARVQPSEYRRLRPVGGPRDVSPPTPPLGGECAGEI